MKRIGIILFALVLAVSCLPFPALAEAATPYETYELRYILKEYGYYREACEGDFEKETSDAISAFQRDRGLASTGEADEDTVAAIRSAGSSSAGITVKSRLNVREKPDSDSDVIDYLTRRSTVCAYSFCGEWVRIETDTGTAGFVKKKFLEVGVKNGIPGKTRESAAVYASPRTDAAFSSLRAGEELWIVGGTGDWFEADLDGEYRFILRSCVDLGGAKKADEETKMLDEPYTAHVTCELLKVRSGPSTGYTVKDTLNKMTAVTVTGENGDWLLIRYESDKTGYVSGGYLKKGTGQKYATVRVDSVLKVREKPGTDGAVVATLSDGTVVSLLDDTGRWYKIKTPDGITGYALSDYLLPGGTPATPTPKPTSTPKKTPKPADKTPVPGKTTPAPGTSKKAAEIIEYAKTFLGRPYVLGANGPDSFDCTGFTKYVYGHFGIKLPRTSYDQGYNGPGKKITNVNDLLPGDLLIFDTKEDNDLSDHAAIYMGNGEFIHASSGSTYRVTISKITSNYYSKHFSWARRVIE